MNGESAPGAARGLWFSLTVDGVSELARDASQVEALVTVTAQWSEHGAAPAGAAAEIIIMDSSGSMRRGGMLQEAKRAVAAAVDALAENTYFAVIAGSHVAEQVYPPRGLAAASARAKGETMAQLSNRAAVGGTAMGAWLTLADSLFSAVPDAIRHAVLYTDGINEHETPEDLRSALRACRDHFVCDVRGVGLDWDGREVQQVADALQGQVAAITDIADLRQDFTGLMEQAQRLVVREAFLRLTLDRRFRVSSVRQTWPTENDLTDRCVPDDGGIVDVPLLAWAEESREYLIVADTDPGTLPYDEVRVARVDVLARRDDASAPAPCASPAAVTVRRLRSDSPASIPKGVTQAADMTRLSAAELAGADALERGDRDAGLRELTAAVAIAGRTGATDHLDRLRGVVTIDEYQNVRLRSPIDRAALLRLAAAGARSAGGGRAATRWRPAAGVSLGQRARAAGAHPAGPAQVRAGASLLPGRPRDRRVRSQVLRGERMQPRVQPGPAGRRSGQRRVNVARSAIRPIAVRWPARLSLPRPAWPDPVRGLRWLRAGVLAMIIACAALCLLVTYQGHRELAAATGPGAKAITDVNRARHALIQAGLDAPLNFAASDASLAGAGDAFSVELAAANEDLTRAAGENIAGRPGATKIQFTQGLLATYSADIAWAGADAIGSAAVGRADVQAAQGTGGKSGILGQAELSLADSAKSPNLRLYERNAVRAALRSPWLGPGDVWPLLLAPFLAMLLLGAGTTGLLWRGFRRVLSGRLVIALGLTLGLVILVAQLTAHDASQARSALAGPLGQARPASVSKPSSSAYSPWSLALGLILAGGATVLAYASYRPRIEEYRYRP